MFQSNLGFVFRKTVGRVIENTVLRYVLTEINTNFGVPLLQHEIERALEHDQPEAVRLLLLQALERLDRTQAPPAVALMPPMWLRDP